MSALRAAARRAGQAIACGLAGALGLAACGTSQAEHEALPTVTITAQPQLGATLQTGAGTWAVVPMGSSGTNLFWELLLRRPVRPPGSW